MKNKENFRENQAAIKFTEFKRPESFTGNDIYFLMLFYTLKESERLEVLTELKQLIIKSEKVKDNEIQAYRYNNN